MCLVVCSLCPYEFDNEDPDFEKRIERHTEYHTKTKGVTRSHHGSNNIINRNMIKGTPTFTEKKN